MSKSMMAMKSAAAGILATLLMATLALPLLSAQGIPSDPSSVARWYKRLPYARQRTVTLHFYFQDVVSGTNPTAVEVARAESTATSPTFFGLVRVFDDPLTVEGDPASQVVGYGQGLYALTSKEDASLLFAFTFVFNEGRFSGSTLSVLGRNPLGQRYREMPVVGGSGVFRLATGTAVASTYWANETTQDGIVEFYVTVLYYQLPYGSEEEGSAEDM